ncbi:MAG: septum site-determining protein MinC [Firmicutes bacterium]|nr:septum site-determining protein MinC [Bacillota bacterium]
MINKEAVFKGTRDGLLIVLDDECDFKQVLSNLKTKLQAAHGFFQGAQVIVDSGTRQLTTRQRKSLARLINGQAGLTLKGFANDKPADKDEKKTVAKKIKPEQNMQPTPCPGQASELPVMFIDRNLRCGQQVNFAGHVVITGDVNPGAEIIAEGNIVVIGALRGLVHAGAGGDQEAFVAAFRLEPSQLRIAGAFTRSPDDESRQFSGQPEIARLQDGQVVVGKNDTNQMLSLVR